jgi:hypothetical protein
MSTNAEDSTSRTKDSIALEIIELVEKMAENRPEEGIQQSRGKLKTDFTTALAINPLNAEKIAELLVSYTELQISQKIMEALLSDLLLLTKKYKRLYRHTDKGGRPYKKASSLGEAIAEQYFNKNKKYPSAEQLSRLVSQKLQPDAPLEDENGRRCLSVSGARNCIQRVRNRKLEKEYSQKLLSTLLVRYP